jgi:hypothetical protein
MNLMLATTARRAAMIVATLGILAATTAAQSTNPRFGRWKLKSDAPAPQSNIMTYAPFGTGGMRVTIDAVSGSGEASQWGYTTMFDGKDEPVTGNRSADTASVRMITERTAEIVYKRAGQVTQVLTNVLSADGNTIGIVYMRPGADGRPDTVSFATYERIR